MSLATITPIKRRIFDLLRHGFAVRCSSCGWCRETRTPYQAEAIRQRHTCPEEKR